MRVIPIDNASVLVGLGAWVPPRVVTNDELCATLDTTADWIESRTGIRERRVVMDGLATSDLAVEAGNRALKSACMADVDAVVIATTSPDRTCPATAPEVAFRMGLGNVAAYDVASACGGFLYGLATASGLIAAGIAETVLFIGAEAFSTFVNPQDRTTAAIFGDGAGAVVLRRGSTDEPGAIGPFDLGSDGAGTPMLAVPAGGSRQRAASHGLGHGEVSADEYYLHMSGRVVYHNAVARMTASANEVLRRADWSVASVDRFIGHQANARILSAVGERLGIPPERVPINIDRVGNALAASIPILLAESAASGELRAGQRVLLSAFGAGYSWGSTVLVWPEIHADNPL